MSESKSPGGASITAQTVRIEAPEIPKPIKPPAPIEKWIPYLIIGFAVVAIISGAVGYYSGKTTGHAEGKAIGHAEGNAIGYAKGKAEAETYYVSSKGIVHNSSCIHFRDIPDSRNCKICGGKSK